MRNFIFGVEDSLVSTVGLLSGVATAGSTRAVIIMTGVVLIFVEAFSMAVGSYLAERATKEYGKKEVGSMRATAISSAIMLGSYFGAGLIPLSPYIITDPSRAFYYSIVASLFALAVLGIISAKVLKLSVAHNALRMFLMGGFAIALGVFVGALFT
jgi:VIT1/CCC1 family predicted Fe2+/Mn2+ transporter